MTESEKLEACIENFKKDLQNGYHGDCISIDNRKTAIASMEEIQQYRAIGSVKELQKLKEYSLIGLELANIYLMGQKLKEYEAIGSVEACREAVEKQEQYKKEG